MFKVIETFSGIGSQAKALERIGIPFEIVHTAEWDIYSTLAYCLIHKGKLDVAKYEDVSDEKISEYLKNMTLSSDGKSKISPRFFNQISSKGKRLIYTAFKETNNLGSVTDITWEDVPEDIDLLTYSFPCQDLSLCGFWHGNFTGIDRNSGNRSSLLWEIERLLYDIKRKKRSLPRFLVMENVKALLSNMHRENFQMWQDELEQLGYLNHIYCLNASDFGVPQKRQRVYMISIYCGKSRRLRNQITDYLNEHDLEINNEYEHRHLTLNDILKIDYTNNTYRNEAMSVVPNSTPSRKQIYEENDHLVQGDIIQNIVVKTLTTKQDRNPNSGVIDYPEDLKVPGKSNFRYLTPRECFMLMGFDEDDYNILIKNDVNLTNHNKRKAFTNERLTKMAGNSIVVDVLEAVFQQLIDINEMFFNE